MRECMENDPISLQHANIQGIVDAFLVLDPTANFLGDTPKDALRRLCDLAGIPYEPEQPAETDSVCTVVKKCYDIILRKNPAVILPRMVRFACNENKEVLDAVILHHHSPREDNPLHDAVEVLKDFAKEQEDQLSEHLIEEFEADIYGKYFAAEC